MLAGEASLARHEPRVAWVNGWRRTDQGLRLEAVVQRGRDFSVERSTASLLLADSQAFSNPISSISGTAQEIIRIEVDDLSRMLSLKRPPGGLLHRALPQTRASNHVVFIAEGPAGTAYIPAALLIRELWLWSRDSLEALLTPGSLDLFLSGWSEHDNEEPHVGACGPFARARGPNLRRLSWLAQCADARASWSSVLTFANAETLNLQLPNASFMAWGVGVQLQRGILISKLASPRVGFTLPVEGVPMRIGTRATRCPFAPAWISDPQPNFW